MPGLVELERVESEQIDAMVHLVGLGDLKGLLTPPGGPSDPSARTVHERMTFLEGALAMVRSSEPETWKQILPHYHLRSECMVRQVAAGLRQLAGMNAYPSLQRDPRALDQKVTKVDVVKIVLDSLPTPSEDTPWEQILEYRADPDSRSRLLALRIWINEVASSHLASIEVEEKLEWLTHEYEAHMRLHRMKTTSGILETVVTATAELLEDIVKLKWGRAAKAVFDIRRARLALAEAELSVPGRELAYIARARQEFLG